MDQPKAAPRFRLMTGLSETFGLSATTAAVVTLLLAAICLLATVWFVRSIPPRTLTVTSGRPGSSFQRFAESYQKILATHGVKLKIVPSEGSPENLARLQSATSGIDIGFVQSGVAKDQNLGHLVSLGSVAYQPLWVFYRGPKPLGRLSEFAGRRIAVGAVGSGTHALALTLLTANGITGPPTTLLDLEAEMASAALLEGKIDALFLMGDSAPTQTLRSLVRSPEVQAYSFTQADAYVRRYPYLNKLALPEGSLDLGQDLPAHEVVLIGPTVELVAREGLNPTLSDLLLEVAQEVHGRAGLLQKSGDFPAPLEHDFKISEDALRYYKSGKGLLYRAVGSFWLASILNRIFVTILPVALLLIPAIRFLPSAYKWRIQLRFYHCYRRLLQLEQDALGPRNPGREQELLQRLDEIEAAVNRLKVPAALADQFYGLRGHLNFVRERLQSPPA